MRNPTLGWHVLLAWILSGEIMCLATNHNNKCLNNHTTVRSTSDADYEAYLSKELPGEGQITALDCSSNEGDTSDAVLMGRRSNPAPLLFSNHRTPHEEDVAEIMRRDWIAEPYEIDHSPDVDSDFDEIDIFRAYLIATTNASVTAFLIEVCMFLRRTFGIGSIVWGIKHHHSLLADAAFNPIELYVYNDHPKWKTALSPPAALLHALFRFYPDAAHWMDALRHRTNLLQPRDGPCASLCRPGPNCNRDCDPDLTQPYNAKAKTRSEHPCAAGLGSDL